MGSNVVKRVVVGTLVLGGLLLAGRDWVYAQAALPSKGGEVSPRENVFGLGLFGGATSGIGLSFRHHLPARFSYQVTGGIIKVSSKISSAIGLELQFDISRKQSNRYFIAAGGGYYYSGTSEKNDMKAPGRFGVGVGGEVQLSAEFHVSGDLLFTYFTDGTVLPLPQIGIFYYFY
jgi:hypothetical protein